MEMEMEMVVMEMVVMETAVTEMAVTETMRNNENSEGRSR
jgi:hypothetical protein